MDEFINPGLKVKVFIAQRWGEKSAVTERGVSQLIIQMWIAEHNF